MTTLKIGDVTVDKVIERDRSATPVGFMLPDATPERIAAQREWLGLELLDPATGNHKATIHSYIVRTPWHSVVIDTCVGNDKPRSGVQPWHMRSGSYLADLSAAGLKPEDVDLVVCHMTTMADWLLAAMKQSAARQHRGEAVTELAHALQCGDLAEAGGADEELVLASLLHDVGRFAVGRDEISETLEQVAARAAGARGHHEAGADLVAPYVPERVAFLVRAHADAKRYLCATDTGYYDSLSPASKHTLALQGGVMQAEEARRVETHRWWADVVRLRRWDDDAKVVGKKTRPLNAWKPLLEKYLSAIRAAR